MFLKFVQKSRGPSIAKIILKIDMFGTLILPDNRIKAAVNVGECYWLGDG